MVLVKKWPFLELFLLVNIVQENVPYDILEENNAFLGYKNKILKGVNLWFRSKNGHFSNLFFVGNIGQENILNDFLERENAFLGY